MYILSWRTSRFFYSWRVKHSQFYVSSKIQLQCFWCFCDVQSEEHFWCRAIHQKHTTDPCCCCWRLKNVMITPDTCRDKDSLQTTLLQSETDMNEGGADSLQIWLSRSKLAWNYSSNDAKTHSVCCSANGCSSWTRAARFDIGLLLLLINQSKKKIHKCIKTWIKLA